MLLGVASHFLSVFAQSIAQQVSGIYRHFLGGLRHAAVFENDEPGGYGKSYKCFCEYFKIIPLATFNNASAYISICG